MKQLVEQVKQWGIDRGLDKVGHLAQAKYTLKETAELLDAYADSDIDAISDAIGDILVTLIVGASNDESAYKGLLSVLESDRYRINKRSDFDFTSSYMDLVFHASFLMKKSKFDIPKFGYYRDVVLRLECCLSSSNYEFDQDSSIEQCLQLAYDEIKDRTGKLNADGHFIKDK